MTVEKVPVRRILTTGVLISIIVLRLIINPSELPDYDSYSQILENLQWDSDLSLFEIGSYYTFRLSSNVFGDTTKALESLYLLQSVIVFAAAVVALRSSRFDKSGVLFSLALYGPLLAFVTLRATPAYLIVLGACSTISTTRWKGLVVAISAMAFHVSAFIPVVALFVAVISSYPRFRWWQLALPRIAPLLMGVAIMLALGGSLISKIAGAGQVLSLIPQLEKYSLYIFEARSLSGGHLVYFIGCLVLYAIYYGFQDSFNSVVSTYIQVMAVIYSIMIVSPVIAYRMSIYFIPLIILGIPWQKIIRHRMLLLSVQIAAFTLFFSSTIGLLRRV